MADTWVGLQSFWDSFGWDAYDEQTVFDKEKRPAFPHITYESGDGGFAHETFLTAQLWDRDPDWQRLKQKAADIKNLVDGGGYKVNVDGGQLWFKLPENTTFSQPIASGSSDEYVKRILINIAVEYLTV